MAAVLFPALAAAAWAQNRGEAEIAFQGYYLGGSGQRLTDATGVALTFRNFIPSIGLLSGSFQGYSRTADVQFGDNYLELRGAAWAGRRWTLTGGDFRISTNLVDNPFNNIYYPELAARGFRIEALQGKTRYSFFWGMETLQTGPRITIRSKVPQNAVGVSAQRTVGERLQFGARWLRFTSSEKSVEAREDLFPANRDFLSSSSLALQSSYSVTQSFRLFAEATGSKPEHLFESEDARKVTFSLFFGPSLDTRKFTFRTNYVYQGVSYFPVIGYFAGDRRGPFGEARYRPRERLEFYGSASHYTNNLERNPTVPSFRSHAYNAGVSVTLPGKFSANTQFSQFNVATLSPDSGTEKDSKNRQVSLTVNRPIFSHRLRISYRDLNLVSASLKDRQKSTEVEDSFRFKRFNLSAAARIQHAGAEQHKTSLFYRGTAQGQLGRFSLMTQVEMGRDLANKTVFSTSAYNTTVFSVATRLTSRWNLSVEAFRNTLTSNLNPESIFALANTGVGLSSVVSSLNHWNVFVRLAHPLKWGGGLPGGSLESFMAQQIPLVGDVEGFVQEIGLDGLRPAVGIPVSLDMLKTVLTDENGRFRIPEVPEGLHKVTVENELPAEFDPGPQPSRILQVAPRRTARADLNVVRLLEFHGKVTGPKEHLENLVILLAPGDRYTTTDSEGNFVFYNLREGDYEVRLDEKTLPEYGVLKTPGRAPISLRNGVRGPTIVFEFEIIIPEKPIRKVLEQKLSLDNPPNQPQKMDPQQPPRPQSNPSAKQHH